MPNARSKALTRQIDALFSERGRPGEHLVRSYCTDVAGCDCVHHTWSTIPCTVVGRTGQVLRGAVKVVSPRTNQRHRRYRAPLVGTERCLLCGTTWRIRPSAEFPLEVLVVGKAAA